DRNVTGVQTCALPILTYSGSKHLLQTLLTLKRWLTASVKKSLPLSWFTTTAQALTGRLTSVSKLSTSGLKKAKTFPHTIAHVSWRLSTTVQSYVKRLTSLHKSSSAALLQKLACSTTW